MLQAEQVEDGGVPVMDVDGIDDAFVAELVGLAETESGLHAPSGEPGGVAGVVVVAAVVDLGIRRAAKLAGEDDERVFEQAASFEISEQARDGAIDGGGVFAVVFGEVAVLVPAAVIDFHKTNSGLQHASRHEALAAKVVRGGGADAVELFHGVGLAFDVEHAGQGILHAEGEFVRLDEALDGGVLGLALERGFVKLLHEVELGALFGPGELRMGQVADFGLRDGLATVADARALVDGGQKRAAVVRRAAVAGIGAQRDKAGQVFIHAAEAVGDPGTHARTWRGGDAAVHLQEGGRMVRHVGLHAADEAELVRVRGDLREQLADPQAALAALLELPHRGHELARGHLAFADGFARVFRQLGFVIKAVHMRWPAVHAEEKHALGLGGEMRLLRSERRCVVSKSTLRGERTQGEITEARAGALQPFAT